MATTMTPNKAASHHPINILNSTNIDQIKDHISKAKAIIKPISEVKDRLRFPRT